MQMTKEKFLAKLHSLYIVGNMSDSDDNPLRETWTKPQMAGRACCALIDEMMHQLVECEAITSDDCDAFYSNL